MYLNPDQQGTVVLDILQNNFHAPLVDGKCNADNIHEELTIGILAGVLPPMDEEDADMIISLVDEMITEFGEPNEGKVR